MKLTNQVKPVSYLKAHASQILRNVSEGRQPVVITLRGEAKAVLQDIESFEETQESLALLKILALTSNNVKEGKVRPARQAFARIRVRQGRWLDRRRDC